MRLKPIRSEIDYDTALKAIERYFSKPPKRNGRSRPLRCTRDANRSLRTRAFADRRGRPRRRHPLSHGELTAIRRIAVNFHAITDDVDGVGLCDRQRSRS